MTRIATQTILLVVAALLGIYDVWVIAASGYDASVSVIIVDWSRQLPILPFAIGVLAGHLFWPQIDKEKS
jgi:hypothetical protein